MPLTTADCNILNDLLTRETGRISPEIQKRMTGKSIFLDHIKRGPFPDGMGTSITVLTSERSFANEADDTAWTPVNASTGIGNTACLPAVTPLTFGQSTRTFQLYRKALESPDICLEDVRTSFSFSQQLANSVDSLTGAVRWSLEMHAINEYIANMLPGQIVFANAVLTSNVTTGVIPNGPPPTSSLTQGMLDSAYVNIMRDSFGDGAFGRSGAAYVFALVCSSETSRNLIRQNADIRQDWRFAFQGDQLKSPLLEPYGIDKSYGNYAHVICNHVPRYDLVANVMTRRSYWVSSAAIKGTRYDVNPAYLTAQFEMSILFNEKVFKWLVPGNLDSPGGTVRFNTPDYFPASVTWKNIPDRVCNPDGTIGFFRAVLASASMPEHPEYGRCFLHLRCSAPMLQQACD